MNTLYIKAILAGALFGIWPLLMNKSGLNGNVGAFFFSLFVLLCVLPLSVTKLGEVSSANWMFAIGAGITGGIGLLFFTNVIANTTPKDVSLLFIVMIIAQVTIPAIYRVIMTGGISYQKLLAFVLATISVILITTKDRF